LLSGQFCLHHDGGGSFYALGRGLAAEGDGGGRLRQRFYIIGCLGISHTMTSAFHPQSNGEVERVHRQLKDALRAQLASSNWPGHLPWILQGLWATPREDSGILAPLTLPGPVVATAEPPLEDFVAKLRAGVPCAAPLPSPAGGPASSPLAHLATADFVYVRCPPVAPSLSPAYCGPYAVHKRAAKGIRAQDWRPF
jgi:hypothetical protein